jgi:hypothetical protein
MDRRGREIVVNEFSEEKVIHEIWLYTASCAVLALHL